jgi:hypothetical protein
VLRIDTPDSAQWNSMVATMVEMVIPDPR